MSIAIEAAELMECFQWRSDSEQTSHKVTTREVVDELADVLIYCLAMANTLGIGDLGAAIMDKLERSGTKYPADEFQGRFE
jgi:NTP pyrophosphatase (non-canonical NTP hydrolase)